MGSINTEHRHRIHVTIQATGADKTGLLNSDFTKSLHRRSGVTLVADPAVVTVSEIDSLNWPGYYWVYYTPATATGRHFVGAKPTNAAFAADIEEHEDDVVGAVPAVGPYLSTRDNVKLALSITTTGDDQRIDSLLSSVTALCQSYCGRMFFSGSYTEIGDGRDYWSYSVKEYPLSAVTSLHVCAALPRVYDATTLLVEGTDYLFDGPTGLIYRLNGSRFPAGPQVVKAIYTGGFAVIPGDLERSVIEVLQPKLSKGKHQSYHLNAESQGDGSITYPIRWDDVPVNSREVWDLYRDRRVA